MNWDTNATAPMYVEIRVRRYWLLWLACLLNSRRLLKWSLSISGAEFV